MNTIGLNHDVCIVISIDRATVEEDATAAFLGPTGELCFGPGSRDAILTSPSSPIHDHLVVHDLRSIDGRDRRVVELACERGYVDVEVDITVRWVTEGIAVKPLVRFGTVRTDECFVGSVRIRSVGGRWREVCMRRARKPAHDYGDVLSEPARSAGWASWIASAHAIDAVARQESTAHMCGHGVIVVALGLREGLARIEWGGEIAIVI
jgi:hypothetical protein